MNFAHLCKECTCWCLFALSTILMLLMLSLALNDMSVIAGHQTLLQHVINTPLPQLSCTDICEAWYTQQSSGLCCDRYNMELCVQKDLCKKDYVRNNQVSVEVLNNDKFHQITVAVVCVLIMIMVACRKGKNSASFKVQQVIDEKMVEAIKKELEKARKGKDKIEERVEVSGSGSNQLFNHCPSKIAQFSILQDNPSFISNMMRDSINCPQLSQYLKTHSCQQCNYLSPIKHKSFNQQ